MDYQTAAVKIAEIAAGAYKYKAACGVISDLAVIVVFLSIGIFFTFALVKAIKS